MSTITGLWSEAILFVSHILKFISLGIDERKRSKMSG